jgi:hypothetical protein
VGGATNFTLTSQRRGFEGHPAAWGNGELKCYSHDIDVPLSQGILSAAQIALGPALLRKWAFARCALTDVLRRLPADWRH